jgi:hypothetical protein
MAPLVAMIFIMGLFPNIFLSQIKGSVARIRDDYQARLDMNPPPSQSAPAGVGYYRGPFKLLPERNKEAPKPAKPAAQDTEH